MPKVTQRPRASDDIGEIWDYIAADSEAAADSWVDRLDAKLRLLAREPVIGRKRDELASGLRSVAFGRYTIFYEQMPDGIAITRLLHSARDIDAQFGDGAGQ